MRSRFLVAVVLFMALALSGRSSTPAVAAPSFPAARGAAITLQAAPAVHVLYFYSPDCPHCQAVQEEVLAPLQTRYGARFDLRKLEIGVPSNYELLIRAEERWQVRPEARGIPTIVVGDEILIGEDIIRAQFPALVEQGLAQGGLDWPDLPIPEAIKAGGSDDATATAPTCGLVQTSSCTTAAPIWVAYFYQVGCQKCSRAEADLAYVRSRYPQLVVDQFNVYDHTALGQWMAERAGRKDFHTPALFIGNDVLIGETEITPQRIEELAVKYASTGTEKFWSSYNSSTAQGSLVEQFRALGPLTVVFAGLVDGLNPCAFATLVFLVSYLTFSGRKGREVIAVGGAFTFGVFVAYLGVGLGLYKVLDLLGTWLTTFARWVYAGTALLCTVLAVISFFDWLKARRGQLEDMSLRLPPALRKRVNAIVRSGQQARAFVVGALITGVLVSLVELACTGQIYLPTIIFVASIPELRVQAIGYLILYNLVFILPLVVVFFLAYAGTTSHELGRFLEKNTARVKLGAVVLFASLAAWLSLSLL